MNKQVEKEIDKIYNEVFKKVFKKAKKEKKLLNRKEIQKIILKLENSKKYKEFADKFAKELSKKGLSQQRGIWKKYFKAAKSKKHIVLPDRYSDFEKLQFKKAVLHNLKMIKSIPQQVMEVYKYKYVKTLTKQVVNGSLGRKTFEAELLKSGATRAKLIARTETSKLQTTILENRASDLGSVCYRWKSSNDARTRQSHRMMNNVIVFWRKDSEKPLLDNMRGNAGEFPNCRCTPLAIFDEDDLQNSIYKIYDYRIDSIREVNKITLLSYINNGEII